MRDTRNSYLFNIRHDTYSSHNSKQTLDMFYTPLMLQQWNFTGLLCTSKIHMLFCSLFLTKPQENYGCTCSDTKLKPKFIPLHAVRESLPTSVVWRILAYPAISSCDSTRHFSGHSEVTTWRIYRANPILTDIFTRTAENTVRC